MQETTIKKDHELFSTRLSPRDAEQIDELIHQGFFLNRSDFTRQAIREKLKAIEVIEIKDVSLEEAKKLILKYLENHPNTYPSDIAKEFQLDLEVVMRAVKELYESGEVED